MCILFLLRPFLEDVDYFSVNKETRIVFWVDVDGKKILRGFGHESDLAVSFLYVFLDVGGVTDDGKNIHVVRWLSDIPIHEDDVAVLDRFVIHVREVHRGTDGAKGKNRIMIGWYELLGHDEIAFNALLSDFKGWTTGSRAKDWNLYESRCRAARFDGLNRLAIVDNPQKSRFDQLLTVILHLLGQFLLASDRQSKVTERHFGYIPSLCEIENCFLDGMHTAILWIRMSNVVKCCSMFVELVDS